MDGREKKPFWRKRTGAVEKGTSDTEPRDTPSVSGEAGESKPRASRRPRRRDELEPLTRQQAMDAALRLLSVRNRSRHELELALKRKNADEPTRESVLTRLAELGYLNDERFAQERARSLFRRGKFGARGVVQKLRTHGLGDTEAKEAAKAAAVELEVKPLDDARRLLERRGLFGRELTLKEKARAARLLRARGFDPDVARQLISTSALESDELDG